MIFLRFIALYIYIAILIFILLKFEVISLDIRTKDTNESLDENNYLYKTYNYLVPIFWIIFLPIILYNMIKERFQ